MKAIVANVLFGGILGCLSWTNLACANEPPIIDSDQFEVPEPAIISAQLLSSNRLPMVPHIINLVDRIFTVNKSNTPNFSIDQEAQIIFGDRFNLYLDETQKLAANQSPYTYNNSQADLILGFQKTFWDSDRQGKYWGITTIEHWGKRDRSYHETNLAKLNYTQLTSTLPRGNSTLTVSGGGDKNLAAEATTSKEFEKFRGGVSYRHGVVEDVTMGVGFAYEDFLVGFTQLTYNSSDFPLKTTVSLLAKESGLDFRSHVRFEPAENFVLNYYHDHEKDKFDASWNMFSGLTVVADGDARQNTFSTGIKLAIHTDYMSISAKAALDSNNNLQWKLQSNIGGLKFTHQNSKEKSISNVDLGLVELNTLGFQCSAFVKYKSEAKHNHDPFMVWGGKIQSGEKITPNEHLWSLNVGYGTSSYGNGLIASGAIFLNPSISLKLSYQEISATSDDTKVKLQISSK